jgi:hypothetical protein
VPEPKKHYETRGWIESVLRHIPGFRGYQSDELQRDWLADRLQRSKRGLDELAGKLVDAGQLDALPQVEKLRSRIDRLIARIRSAMQGYSGFFDLVQIDEQTLDRIYEHDLALLEQIAALSDGVEALSQKVQTAGDEIPQLLTQIETLEDAWDHREDTLKGLE